MAEKLAHPTESQLSAFSLGQLSHAEAASVETHITQCESCCETLLQLGDDDTFVGLLKEAGGEVGDATIDLAPSSTPSSTPEIRSDASEVPSALASHPRYRVDALIGSGGMGDVYKAEHGMMQRTVALKVINQDLISKPAAVERFHREVRAAARLHHPNIVTAYDAEQAGDTHFLAMEYVEGTELSEIVRAKGRLPLASACDYARQVAIGLEHAFEIGMVHRDIKPQNLMVTPNGEVKILDFGLANFASESVAQVAADDHAGAKPSDRLQRDLTQHGTTMGTPDYMAPEQAEDARSADIRSDIYSLGCTLYYLLTGRPPFSEASVAEKLEAHRHRAPEPLRKLRDEIPVELESIVYRMMAKDPADRYQTPAQVATALEEFSDPLRRPAPNPAARGSVSGTSASARGQRGHGIRWLVAAASAAIAMTVMVIATDRGRLTIQSEADDVQVVVKQGGDLIRTIDLKSGSQVTWLASGKYELELVGNDNRVELNNYGFKMTRLGAVLISARWSGGGQEVLRSFVPSEPTITRDHIEPADGGWKITANEARTVRLFEAPLPSLKPGSFFYRAKIKTEDLDGRAYLEMWVRFPGKGEFFSKGLHNAVSGDNGWAEYEIPFLVPEDQQPDQVKLNLAIEGKGAVWIKDIELRGQSVATLPGEELQAAFTSFLHAAASELDDEEGLSAVLKTHAPILAGMNPKGAQVMIRLLENLPTSDLEKLMKKGFLKWKFRSLDSERQTAMRSFVRRLIQPTIEFGFPADLADKTVQMLESSDVGFAVITIPDANPDANDQYIVWYRMLPNSPTSPITFPIFGDRADRTDRTAKRALQDQLDMVAKEPCDPVPRKAATDKVEAPNEKPL